MSSQDFSLIDKLPQSIDLEIDVLAAIILSGEKFALIKNIISSYDFALPEHKQLFHAMEQCFLKNNIFDYSQLYDFIKSNELLAKVGSEENLHKLKCHVPNLRKIENYAKQIKNKSIRRQQTTTAVEIISKLKEDRPETDQEIDTLISKLKDQSYKPLEDVYFDAYDLNRQFITNITQKQQIGIPTYFIKLDELTGGFMPKTLTTLAAETSFGKTTFALNMALKMCLEKQKVAYLSLEMTNFELIGKINSMFSQVSYMDLIKRNFSDDEWEHMRSFSENVILPNHFFICEVGLDINQIIMTTRHLKKEKNISLLIVDHLQFIQSKRRFDNRNHEISEYTHKLKELAKELNISILILSQLNRGNVMRADKRPMAHDLRDSGSIAQDSDNIWFLFRESIYNKDFQDKNQTELIIRKNRIGERDIAIYYDFNARISLFTEKPYLPERV